MPFLSLLFVGNTAGEDYQLFLSLGSLNSSLQHYESHSLMREDPAQFQLDST